MCKGGRGGERVPPKGRSVLDAMLTAAKLDSADLILTNCEDISPKMAFFWLVLTFRKTCWLCSLQKVKSQLVPC